MLDEAREQGLPDDWLPICEYNGCYYCLTPNGTVRYWTLDGALAMILGKIFLFGLIKYGLMKINYRKQT